MVAILIAVAATAFPMSKLEEMVNVGTLFVTSWSRLGDHLRGPNRGFRAPFVPALPILSIPCLWLMLNLTALTWIRFVV